MSDHADMDKHSDAELREGIRKADEQEPRVEEESSEAAHAAQREQREQMDEALRRRQS